MPTNINGIQLRIVAEANGYDVRVALLIDGSQPAKPLALQVLDLGRCKIAHNFFLLILFDADVKSKMSVSAPALPGYAVSICPHG
jgi:hypothetical protein